MRLEDYRNEHPVLVGVATLQAEGVYGATYEWPCIDYIWDASRKVFGFQWAGDENGPHAFRIIRVDEASESVTLYHNAGKITLEELWNDDQRAIVKRWEKEPKRKMSVDYKFVQGAVDAVAGNPPDPPPHSDQAFDVMVDMAQQGDGSWLPIGAWAANDTSIFYQTADGERDANTENIQSALADGWKPRDIMAYWYDQGYTVVRTTRPVVSALSAVEAAIIGLRRAQEDKQRNIQ